MPNKGKTCSFVVLKFSYKISEDKWYERSALGGANTKPACYCEISDICSGM